MTTDKIFDAAAAQRLQAYAVCTYRLSGWIVMQDQPNDATTKEQHIEFAAELIVSVLYDAGCDL